MASTSEPMPDTQLFKAHIEALVKEIGLARACEITGVSDATMRRAYSQSERNRNYMLSLDAVTKLEQVAKFPHVTAVMAEQSGYLLSKMTTEDARLGSVNSDVMQLAERFARLMSEYYDAIADHEISRNEANRLLADAQSLQEVLVDLKRNLERERDKTRL